MKYLLILMLCSTAPIAAVEFTAHSPTPYIIYRKDFGAGFWSNFFVLLAGIDRADREGWVPVIDIQQHQSLYKENEPVFGILNAWEYFFEQPGGMSLETALSLNYIDNEGGIDGVFSRAHTIQPSPEKKQRAQELIKKYIKIKPNIINEVDSIISPGIDYSILGVHVRGTDRRRGAPNHLLTATADLYLSEAKKLDELYEYTQIFLACDELETLEMFRDAFGARLIFTEGHRVSAYSNDAVHHAEDIVVSRPQHKYLLGREVLMDALLLARAGHLLCGPSNVSFGAMYFAEEEQMIHEVESPGFFQPTTSKL